jgi:hypothetical protein
MVYFNIKNWDLGWFGVPVGQFRVHEFDVLFITILSIMRNHVKLEIHLFVMNFNSGGFSFQDTMLCSGYWLWAWQRRHALPEGQKYQMVKTKSESHDRKPIVWTTWWQIWVSFPLKSAEEWLDFVMWLLGGAPKLSSSGLAISMTNPIVQNF